MCGPGREDGAGHRRTMLAEREDVVLKTRSVWALLVVGAVLVALAGCATTTTSTPMVIGANDVAKLAGSWQGRASGPSSAGYPATLSIKPDGTYELAAGSFTSAGTLAVKDGRLIATNTSSSGIPPEKRVSEAVLTERGEQMVLTGWGHSTWGPFSYELSRQK